MCVDCFLRVQPADIDNFPHEAPPDTWQEGFNIFVVEGH